MVFLPTFITLLTISFAIGVPLLIIFQLLNKKSVLLKIPSLKIWKVLLKTIGAPPKTKLNLLNISFFLQMVLLGLLAYLSASPFIYQNNNVRPTFNILINRSTSMATKSSDNVSRWDILKKTIYNRLIQCGLQSDDKINVLFNPPLNSLPKEVSLNQIDKVINEENVVELPPSDMPLFQMTKMKGQYFYVTDSIAEIPNSLKNKVTVVYIKDEAHINVGWIEFWVEDQTINGVIKNYSDFSLNVNIDLKINGVSVQANDFDPAIKPKSCFYYSKKIQEDMSKNNLIEILITCPGDSLLMDNYVALSRMSSQKLRVFVSQDVPVPILKALRSLNEGIEIMQGDVLGNLHANSYDLLIGVKYENQIKINQILVNPVEGNAFFNVLEPKVNSNINATQWLNTNELKLFENVTIENIKELKELVPGGKLLTEAINQWPIVARWMHESNFIYLLNFDCSEKATMVQTPSFPFLIAKVLEDMNLNKFHYFKTGDTINSFTVPTSLKVFQSNQKENSSSINFIKADSVLLTNAGLYSNENINICVNLLNENESNIKQEIAEKQTKLDFHFQSESLPFDLKPFIAGLLLLIFVIEWMVYKKEN